MISNEFLDSYSANAQPLGSDMLTYLKFLAINQYLEAVDFIQNTTEDEYEDAAILFDFLLTYRCVDADKPTSKFEEEWEALSGNFFTPTEGFKDAPTNTVISNIVIQYENLVTQAQTILAIQALTPIAHKLQS